MGKIKTIKVKLRDNDSNAIVTLYFSCEDQIEIIKELWKRKQLWDVLDESIRKDEWRTDVLREMACNNRKGMPDELYNALGKKKFDCLIEGCKEIQKEESDSTRRQSVRKGEENRERDEPQRKTNQDFIKLIQKMCADAPVTVEKYGNGLMEIEQANIRYERICQIISDYKEKISPQYELFRAVVPKLVYISAFRKDNINPPPFGDIENSLEDISVHFKAYCQDNLPIGEIRNYFSEEGDVSQKAEEKIREYEGLFSGYQKILSQMDENKMPDEIKSKVGKLIDQQNQMDEELKRQQEEQDILKKQIIYQQEYPFYYDKRAYWDYAELLVILEPILQRIASHGRWQEEEVYEAADSIRQVMDGASTSQGSFSLLDCNGDESFNLNFDYSTYNQPVLCYREKNTERLQCLTRGKTSQDWR